MRTAISPGQWQPYEGVLRNGGAYIRGGGGGLMTGLKKVFQNKLHSSAD